MLKSMRKNLKSLAPALWFVIAAFIISIFAVWGGAGRLGEGRASNAVASVGSKRISAETYYSNLRQRLESLKEQYQDLDPNFIQQLNIPYRVLEEMIQRSLLLQAAGRMGIRASDEEIRDRIISYPVFQKDGQFIGVAEYERILSWNRISVEEFEKNLAEDVILDKLVKAVTAGIAISDEEIWESFRNSSESVKMDYAALETSKVEYDQEPDPAVLREYFEARKDEYKIPERREGTFVFFNTDELRAEIQVSDEEIGKYYQDNAPQFREPEKVRVSRIFIPLDGREQAQSRAEAQSILDRIRAGEDFGQMALVYSKDRKASEKGDWGPFEWRELAPPEQTEIGRLEAGGMSGVVDLEDGASIIKVTEKEAAVTRPLEEVKGQIMTILQDERGRSEAEGNASRLEKEAKKNGSLTAAAQKLGFTTQSTGLVKSGESLILIDPSGAISQTMFSLEESGISAPVFTYKGVGIVQLEKSEPPRPASFEEVELQVRDDYIDARKKEIALERMNRVKSELASSDIETLGVRYGLEVKTAEEHKRGQYLSTIGESDRIDRLAFTLPIGEPSDPVDFGSGFAVIRILERKEVTREEFAEKRDEERDNALQAKKNQFFSSYVTQLREDIGVKIRYDLFTQVSSEILSRYTSQEEPE